VKYKYDPRAGALNEANLGPPPPGQWAQGSAAPVTRVTSASTSTASLADLTDSDDYVGAHTTGVTMMPVAAAPVHAQSRGRRGRALPPPAPAAPGDSLDPIRAHHGGGMFFYTVQDGQRVRVIEKDGRVSIVPGPKRIYQGSRRIEPMAHHVAHPGEFLIVRFRDGRQEHLVGPADLWFDPRTHATVEKEDALQIASKEAVVVYTRDGDGGEVSRRVVNGPAAFVPEPGEWLHTFSWHGAKGGHLGYQKVPNGLVFQKLWFLPDQMYHDVPDVRTSDDAVLTIRLMIFFELVDVTTMLDSSHDPIGDMVNATTSDVVELTGKLDFVSFKKQTDRLNDLATYRQLTARAGQCGYRINKVVYRGYGAPDSIQRMHDEAIEQRTRLALDRATQEQAQDLEDFKLERDLGRAARHRTEQGAHLAHEIGQAHKRQEAALRDEGARRDFTRLEAQKDAEQEAARIRARDEAQRLHLTGLKGLGVELTALLTQGRADRVIELRGGGGVAPHLHLSAGRHGEKGDRDEQD
jgi:hypothetical protein